MLPHPFQQLRLLLVEALRERFHTRGVHQDAAHLDLVNGQVCRQDDPLVAVAWTRILRKEQSCLQYSFDSEGAVGITDRKSTRLNSSDANISYAVFCLKK